MLHTLPLTLACEFTQPDRLCSQWIAIVSRPRSSQLRPQSERLYRRTHVCAAPASFRPSMFGVLPSSLGVLPLVDR